MYIKEKEYQVIHNEIIHELKLHIQIHYYVIKMTIIYYIPIYINY
jgi:hypothetical protein